MQKIDYDQLIGMAMHGCLDKYDLIKSLPFVEELYIKKGFNGKGKYGMTRKLVIEYATKAEILLLEGLGSYENLKEANFEYVRNFEACISNLDL